MRHFFCDSLKRFLMALSLTVVGIFSAHAATLPSGYTELEWIKSDGTQRIDTGIIATEKTGIETQFINNYGDSATRVLIGDSWNTTKFALTIVAQTNSYAVVGAGRITQANFWSTNKLFTVKMDINGLKINNDAIRTWPTAPGTFTASQQLHMFAPTDVATRGAIVTMYYTKIYQDGELVRNFVPAKRDSDSVIGMYDTVNNQFYTNQGSGTFIAGPATCRNLFDENSNLNTHNPCAVVGNYPSINATTPRPNARTYFMTVKPNTTYTISMSSVGDRLYVFGINDIINPYDYTGDNRVTFNRTILSYQSTIPTTVTFATNSTEKMIAVYYALENIPTHFQIEEGSTATAYAPYCAVSDGIKIATTKYTEDAFAGLMTTLSEAITKVTNIVDTTVQQATEIGNLATTKQDRPDTDCPAGRKCLLIMGADNKPHWYLIQE